jgi:hypothetical protein
MFFFPKLDFSTTKIGIEPATCDILEINNGIQRMKNPNRFALEMEERLQSY